MALFKPTAYSIQMLHFSDPPVDHTTMLPTLQVLSSLDALGPADTESNLR